MLMNNNVDVDLPSKWRCERANSYSFMVIRVEDGRERSS